MGKNVNWGGGCKPLSTPLSGILIYSLRLRSILNVQNTRMAN